MTEKRDHRFSSKDLIREAREGLAAGAVTEDKAHAPVSSDEMPVLVRQPLQPEPIAPDSPPDPVADDPVVPSSMPEHGEYRPYMPTQKQRGTGRLLKRFSGLIIVGVIVLGGVVWNALDATKSVENLTVGDCLEQPSNELITSVETITCDEPHDYEVYAVVQLLEPKTAPYPGQEETFFASVESCFSWFEGYVGLAYSDSVYDINTIYPTRDSWDNEEDREVICLVAKPSPSGDIVPVTGSVNNARR